MIKNFNYLKYIFKYFYFLMSGSIFSSGNMFNKGDMGSQKEQYFDLKIKSATLYTMNLKNVAGTFFTTILKGISAQFLPFINTPKIRHYALALKTVDNRIIIIEYGQYLNKNSERKNLGIFGSSSNKNCRESENNNIYYYLLNDGARFYEIHANENVRISLIIASNYFGISLEEANNMDDEYSNELFHFSRHQMNVGNEITLGELVNHFINDNNWNAKDYKLLGHNCQNFVAKCIKILKLTRMDEMDKKRYYEIEFFPPCVLSALYDNESWSAKNIGLRILQRIPLIGMYIKSS